MISEITGAASAKAQRPRTPAATSDQVLRKKQEKNIEGEMGDPAMRQIAGGQDTLPGKDTPQITLKLRNLAPERNPIVEE